MKHYETLVPGDIICVQNDCSEFAYFGELNANIAIRAGAIGAVVGGMTRDKEAVNRLDFPVFAEGHCCQDVKNRAVLESMNHQISIKSVCINPGDVIFADDEGVICIPKNYWSIVLDLAQENIKNEKQIVSDIAAGIHVNLLRSERGDF